MSSKKEESYRKIDGHLDIATGDGERSRDLDIRSVETKTIKSISLSLKGKARRKTEQLLNPVHKYDLIYEKVNYVISNPIVNKPDKGQEVQLINSNSITLTQVPLCSGTRTSARKEKSSMDEKKQHEVHVKRQGDIFMPKEKNDFDYGKVDLNIIRTRRTCLVKSYRRSKSVPKEVDTERRQKENVEFSKEKKEDSALLEIYHSDLSIISPIGYSVDRTQTEEDMVRCESSREYRYSASMDSHIFSPHVTKLKFQFNKQKRSNPSPSEGNFEKGKINPCNAVYQKKKIIKPPNTKVSNDELNYKKKSLPQPLEIMNSLPEANYNLELTKNINQSIENSTTTETLSTPIMKAFPSKSLILSVDETTSNSLVFSTPKESLIMKSRLGSIYEKYSTRCKRSKFNRSFQLKNSNTALNEKDPENDKSILRDNIKIINCLENCEVIYPAKVEEQRPRDKKPQKMGDNKSEKMSLKFSRILNTLIRNNITTEVTRSPEEHPQLPGEYCSHENTKGKSILEGQSSKKNIMSKNYISLINKVKSQNQKKDLGKPKKNEKRKQARSNVNYDSQVKDSFGEKNNIENSQWYAQSGQLFFNIDEKNKIRKVLYVNDE